MSEINGSLAQLRTGAGKPEKKNGNSRHHPPATLFSRISDWLRFPAPFRSSRFVTLFRMD
jgi:hypothetical protein